MPIKVLQLGSPIGLYGAERWILALVKHLDPTKITSIVGVIKDNPHQPCSLCKEAEKLGFQNYCFEAHGKISRSMIRQLRQFILEHGINILHTHFYKTDIIGFIATRGTSCKIISTPHGWTQGPDIKMLIYEMLDRMLFPFLDTVAPLSDKMLQSLKIIPTLNRKLHLINNGVDITEVSEEKKIDGELMGWKKDGSYIIGYIGRLVTGKDLNTLISALAGLQELKWRLAIIGEGREEQSLKNLSQELALSDRIKFFGYRTDRISLLKALDVFVLPSRSEGIPRCLMEAMAAKVPVVASDIPGCRYLVKDHQTGLLFPVGSSAKLTEKIHAVLADKHLRNTLSENGYQYILQKYSAQRMALEYEALFLDLVNNTSSVKN
jgi:glycosyltransferase involved in cell wall biosynthesis